jgi:hypothetical protein
MARPAADSLPPMSAPVPSVPSARRPAGSGGITAVGLFLLETATLGVAALLIGWLSDGLGGLFQILFVAVAAFGALRVRRRDLLAGFIVPPLAYAAAIVIGSPALGVGKSVALGIGSNLASFLAVGAPWLFLGTLLAFCITVWRGRTGR